MQIQQVIQALERLVASDADSLTGVEAARLAEQFAAAERLCVAGKLRFAARVHATRGFEASGHRDAVTWLASVSKEPVGKARGALALGKALSSIPAVEEAFNRGELSAAGAKVVSEAAAVDPSAAASLLDTARTGDLTELSRAASRIERAALGEAGELAKERRLHRARFCRWWLPETGGVRFEALMTRADGARVLATLDDEAKRLVKNGCSFDQAKAEKKSSPHGSLERDGGECVVPGCHATRFLEIDHWKYDYHPDGPTVLWNLCAWCSGHHAMKSHGDFTLLGGPGRWEWVPTRQLFDRQRHQGARIIAERQAKARGESVVPRSRTG